MCVHTHVRPTNTAQRYPFRHLLNNSLEDVAFLSDADLAPRLKIFRLEGQPAPPLFEPETFKLLSGLKVLYVSACVCLKVKPLVYERHVCLCRFLRNIQLTAQALPARAFADLGSLVMLGLPENQLSYLRADWWAPAGVSTLQVLDLHQNAIASLEPGVFDGLAPSLVSLDLHSNSLVVLPEQLFNVSFPVLNTWLVAVLLQLRFCADSSVFALMFPATGGSTK